MDRTTALTLLDRATAPEPLDLAELLEELDRLGNVSEKVRSAGVRGLRGKGTDYFEPDPYMRRYGELASAAMRDNLTREAVTTAHRALTALSKIVDLVESEGLASTDLREQLEAVVLRAA